MTFYFAILHNAKGNFQTNYLFFPTQNGRRKTKFFYFLEILKIIPMYRTLYQLKSCLQIDILHLGLHAGN